MTKRSKPLRLATWGLICCLGCATQSRPSNKLDTSTTMPPTYGSSRVVVKHGGTPTPRVERLTRIADWPRRTFRKDSKDPREVSSATIEQIVQYLEENNLTDVTVYVNHYDPTEMWYRLVHNERVGSGWRYTAGRVGLLGYRLLPPPAFARTEYDPYTNSLYLNSDTLVQGMSAAAVAKELHESDRPGTTYVVTRAPGFAFLHARRNFLEVVGYAQAKDNWELEQQAYRDLCPRLGAESVQVGSFFVTAWWGGIALNAAGTAGGYVVGRRLEAQRVAERAKQAEQLEFVESTRPPVPRDPQAIANLPGSERFVPAQFESHATPNSVGDYFGHEQWERPVMTPR
jgi:hypothetical protein